MARDDLLDKAAALADTSLTPYRGHDVKKTTIKITNAGDGLSSAMKIDPVEFDLGDTVYVVLECEVRKHEHQAIEDTDTMQLVQTLSAQSAVVVDRDLVKKHLDEQKERIQAAKDEAAGRVNLAGEHGWLSDSDGEAPEGDEDEETLVLRRNHMAGSHEDAAYDGCPLCEATDAG